MQRIQRQPEPPLLVVHGKVGFDEHALSLSCRIAKYQVIFLWLVLCRGYGVIHRLIVRRIQLEGCRAGSMVQKVIELLFVQYHHVNVSGFAGTGIRSSGKRAEVSPQFRTHRVGQDNKCELGIRLYRFQSHSAGQCRRWAAVFEQHSAVTRPKTPGVSQSSSYFCTPPRRAYASGWRWTTLRR